MTVDSMLAAQPAGGVEIIVVDDQSQDDCCRFLKTEPGYSGVRYWQPRSWRGRARNYGAAARQRRIFGLSATPIYVRKAG